MAELAVLVPTLHRADRLAALVENIHTATLTCHTIYLVMESCDSDSERAAQALDTVDVIGDFGSCAAALNAGYRASTEPYLFTANDDLEFPEGWELPALEMIQGGIPIVGVNEGHDRLTCFAMVERAFIERESGVFDKPNTLCHEYASQYVDTELAEYARHRGVWGEARDGGVIHRHWEWGQADPNHPNYAKARVTVAEDARVFEQRRKQWSQS